MEHIPEGPTVRLMQEVARKHQMVMIVPIYEEEITGLYYNTAAVIDADGTYLGSESARVESISSRSAVSRSTCSRPTS